MILVRWQVGDMPERRQLRVFFAMCLTNASGYDLLAFRNDEANENPWGPSEYKDVLCGSGSSWKTGEYAGVVSLHTCPAFVLFLHVSATGCCCRKSGHSYGTSRSCAVNAIWNNLFGTVWIYFWNLLKCVNTSDAIWIQLNSKVVLLLFLVAFLLLSCRVITEI